MAGKSKKDFIPHIEAAKAPACNVAGCVEPGGYKAPVSRDRVGQYQWFCLEHIREYNAQWDYFAGQGADEIESFVREAVTGHRPTWTRESRIRDHYLKLQDALHDFLSGTYVRERTTPHYLSGKVRRALATMDISYPFTEQALKAQYRVLVKKFHPDVNKGDKKSEEKFKQISTSYSLLVEYLKRS